MLVWSILSRTAWGEQFTLSAKWNPGLPRPMMVASAATDQKSLRCTPPPGSRDGHRTWSTEGYTTLPSWRRRAGGVYHKRVIWHLQSTRPLLRLFAANRQRRVPASMRDTLFIGPSIIYYLLTHPAAVDGIGTAFPPGHWAPTDINLHAGIPVLIYKLFSPSSSRRRRNMMLHM